MLLEQTLGKLRELKLYGMLAAIEQQAERPEFHELSFDERL